MAGSVNKVILVGNLGNDPEIRTFGNGGKVANFSLATSENWRDKQSGERREKTEWHRVAVFGEGLVGVIERYVKKGSKLYMKASYKRVSGKTVTGMINIPLKSYYRDLVQR